MNRPEDFQNENNTQNENATGTDSNRSNAGFSGTTPEGFPPIEEPQWYGISYQGSTQYQQGMTGGAYSVATPSTNKRKKRTRAIVVTVAILAILALMLAAGIGGALLVRHFQSDDPDTSEGGGTTFIPSNSSSGLSGGSTIYENKDAETYNYADAAIQKNDGTALVDSENGSAGSAGMTLLNAVAAVQDSVVEIVTSTTSVRGTVTAGAGSGVIIHKDGIIVTNNHVISGFTNIVVIVTDHAHTDEDGNYLQYRYRASVRGTDEDGDIAILKISPVADLTVAKLGSSKDVALAEAVFAIGNPLGELGGTVTSGIISAISREIRVDDVTMTLLQTDASINSGNSGGGLFNLAGELIGIVNAKYSATGVEGLGFAIPIDIAMESINDLLQYGYIRGIPAVGVTFADGVWREGFYSTQVVYVYDAKDSTVLQYEDIITKVDGVSVSSVSQLRQVIRSYQVGDTVTLTVVRGTKTVTVQVKLIEYKPE